MCMCVCVCVCVCVCLCAQALTMKGFIFWKGWAIYTWQIIRWVIHVFFFKLSSLSLSLPPPLLFTNMNADHRLRCEVLMRSYPTFSSLTYIILRRGFAQISCNLVFHHNFSLLRMSCFCYCTFKTFSLTSHSSLIYPFLHFIDWIAVHM